MRAYHLSVALALLLPAASTGQAPADGNEPALSAADKKYLDGLFEDFLFDPTGARRVAFEMSFRTVWVEPTEKVLIEGWLVTGIGGQPGRVYFADGAWIPAPPGREMKRVDFVASCRARYAAPEEKPAAPFNYARQRQLKTNAFSLPGAGDRDLALAAWLYRSGHEALAARALAAARRGKGDARQWLRADLVWTAFAEMVHAYMVRADVEALAHGERLLRLYPDAAKGEDYGQTAQVVAELKRRQKQGTFGEVPPTKWPEGFATWNTPKKVAFLIDALEEVDARQRGQPGGVPFAEDRRVAELIRLGDAAVPALLDTLEKDERLTRSVHFWRDFARFRTVLSVREAALTALMSILRVRAFTPAATGDNFTARGAEEAKALAKRLRAYWKERGSLPLAERMMRVLTDPKEPFEARREAATNLATLTEEVRLGTTAWADFHRPGPKDQPNPAVAKFSKPTAAEAILAAMDADLRAFDAAPRDDLYDYQRRFIVKTYVWAVVKLGDRRAAPELAKRAKDAPPSARWRLAQAAHALGDPKPFRAFAEDFRAGKVKAFKDDRDGAEELREFLAALAAAGIPEARNDPRPDTALKKKGPGNDRHQ